MYINNFHHPKLHIQEFQTCNNQSWCIYGNNTSGIDTFLQLIEGNLSDYNVDSLELPDCAGIISFARQQELFEEELRNDDSDFLDRIDPGTLVRQFLPGYQVHLPLLRSLDMEKCLDLGFRQLSSGQCRKLLILKELINGSKALILQNPYDGLDEKSCSELDQMLNSLQQRTIAIILLVNTKVDIPIWCSHLAVFDSGELLCSGERDKIVADMLTQEEKKELSLVPPAPPTSRASDNREESEELIFLSQGFAGYGDKKLFSGLNLSISTGDHTLICGHNGCGKSTLLDIITGDNPKCYANNLRIFGRKRGSGESIWDLKKKMGIVSPSLHRNHRAVGTGLHVVLSGLFDSIGLYQKVHTKNIQRAKLWLNWINLSTKETTPFRNLTFAEQRLILIARALVKEPKLLILDEPTHGLDDDNREKLLFFLDQVAEKQLSTILFVSHRRDEHRPFFQNHIQLDSYTP